MSMAQDKAKRRGRSYGLGERRPDSLPGIYKDSESVTENRERTAFWKAQGKRARGLTLVGSKY